MGKAPHLIEELNKILSLTLDKYSKLTKDPRHGGLTDGSVVKSTCYFTGVPGLMSNTHMVVPKCLELQLQGI